MLARRSALAGGLILFAVWSLSTWYLEGRIETLLRPEAVVDRLMCLVGLVTGAFFMASRSAIATTIFHNFLGTFGVLQALAKADALAPLERLQPPLLGTAMVTLFAMLMFQAVIRKRRSAGWRPSSM